MDGYKFETIDHASLTEKHAQELSSFETFLGATYPLGTDRFSIFHGANYLAFFQRLGKVHYSFIRFQGQLIGTACIILRRHSWKGAEYLMPFWYICDVKVDPKHRGKNLTSLLFASLVPKFITTSMLCYMISMDPDSKQIVSIASSVVASFPFIQLQTKTLKIYSISSIEEMKKVMTIFSKWGVYVSFLSLNGLKDLIVNGASLPIMHLQYGYNAKHTKEDKLVDGKIYMFCTVSDSILDKELLKINIDTKTTATIISHMISDFDFIMTSDI